jgi:hypothetical protein
LSSPNSAERIEAFHVRAGYPAQDMALDSRGCGSDKGLKILFRAPDAKGSRSDYPPLDFDLYGAG